MYNILKSTGFNYRKTDDGRKLIMEKGDNASAERTFSGQFTTVEFQEMSSLFYLDETCFKQNHSEKCI
jgi:hypothetical protein